MIPFPIPSVKSLVIGHNPVSDPVIDEPCIDPGDIRRLMATVAPLTWCTLLFSDALSTTSEVPKRLQVPPQNRNEQF